eukprot:m.196647 g.196647  ORF g.196647 m.196647 type:complete len:486 (+) comp14909_c1_seq13:581-2038(+)
MASSSSSTSLVDLYEITETIADGTFGQVLAAKHRSSGEAVAIKVIKKEKCSPDQLAKLQQEAWVMKLLHHPHIIQLFQVQHSPKKLYLIMEYVRGGHLAAYVARNGSFTEHTARRLFFELVQAVHYCHQNRVAHRDLKPENVLLTSPKCPEGQAHIKVIDFGLSNNFRPGQLLETPCGTMDYSSPEVLFQQPYDGPRADMWSLGTILLFMLTGQSPFNSYAPSVTVQNILQAKYEVPDVTPTCKNMIQQLLVCEPDDRPSSKDLLKHKWFEGLKPSQALSSHERDLSDFEKQQVLHEMERKGFSRQRILDSVSSNAFDHVAATFFLLSRQIIAKRKPRALSLPDQLIRRSVRTAGLHLPSRDVPTTRHNAALGVLQRHRARAVQLEQHDSPLNSPLFDVEKNTFQPAREDYSPTSRPGSAPVPYHATPETREFTFKAAVGMCLKHCFVGVVSVFVCICARVSVRISVCVSLSVLSVCPPKQFRSV